MTMYLTSVSKRILLNAAAVSEKKRRGEKPKESLEGLHRKVAELDVRLRKRLALLDKQQLMSTKAPEIFTAAMQGPGRSSTGRHAPPAPDGGVLGRDAEPGVRGVCLLLPAIVFLGGTSGARISMRSWPGL
ncbi:hypothetical protein [Streptomyces fradiae]|uniref:hypothetical protein n=1 Tax=Streptomyces fradiae TaxID=1906 RepID=UPI0039858A8F